MTIDAAQKPTRVRYLMLAMMFFTVVINYLDRNNISTTVSAIKGEFHIDNAEMKPLMRSVCAVHGYTCPEICTPLELMGDDHEG